MTEDWRWLEAALREEGPAAVVERVPAMSAFVHLLEPVEPASALVDIACSRLGVASNELSPARRLSNRWPLPDLCPGLRRVVPTAVELSTVRALAVAPDGRMVAGGSGRINDDGNNSILILDPVVGVPRRASHPHPSRVEGAAVSTAGIVVTTSGEAVRIFDLDSGELRLEVPVEEGVCTDVDITPDGKLIAAAINRGEVWLLDVAAGEVRRRFAVGYLPQAVAISPNGTWVAAGGFDNDIHVWDVASAAATVQRGHTDIVYSLEASANGQLLASGGDETGIVWDPHTGRRVATLAHGGEVNVIALSPDSRFAATAGQDGSVQVWDVSTGARVGWFRGHAQPVWGLAFGPNGEWLASGGDDGDVRLWTVGNTSPRSRPARWSYPQGIAVAPDGSWIAIGHGNLIELRDIATGRRLRTLRDGGGVNALAIAPDASWLAAAIGCHTIRRHDLRDGGRVSLKTALWDVNGLAASPDGAWLLASGNDGIVEVWDTATGELRWTRKLAEQHLSGAAVAGDGTWFATTTRRGSVLVVDAATGEIRRELGTDTWALRQVTVAPRTGLVAAVGVHSTLRVWDSATWSPIAIGPNNRARIDDVAFSPDETMLALVGGNELWVCDIASAATVAALRVDAWVYTCRWLADGGICVNGAAGPYLFDYS